MTRPIDLKRLGLLLLLPSLLLAGCISTQMEINTPTPAPPTETPLPPEPTNTPTPVGDPIEVPTELAGLVENAPPSNNPITAGQVAGLPDPDEYTWELFAVGFDRPVFLTNAGDGSNRVFVVERKGVIWSLRAGSIEDTPFLNISEKVSSLGNEQGLLGLAFHPNYVSNGYLYVNYTDLNGDTVISRFETSDTGRANPNTELVLLSVDQPYPNHNGGMLAFGPDGFLYIGLGDGGSSNDPLNNAQNLSNPLGKILRIDVDNGARYSIPLDNPYYGLNDRAQEIWVYGLRNPWRFSFDRITGNLYIGDVGQDIWEEVDFLLNGSLGGTNFGWNYFEGNNVLVGQAPATANLTAPVHEYSHAEGGCAITGGYVYRGEALPDWQGIYTYADYCSGLIWSLLRLPDGTWIGAQMFQVDSLVSSFGEDEAGELYLVSYGDGLIYRLEER